MSRPNSSEHRRIEAPLSDEGVRKILDGNKIIAEYKMVDDSKMAFSDKSLGGRFKDINGYEIKRSIREIVKEAK